VNGSALPPIESASLLIDEESTSVFPEVSIVVFERRDALDGERFRIDGVSNDSRGFGSWRPKPRSNLPMDGRVVTWHSFKGGVSHARQAAFAINGCSNLVLAHGFTNWIRHVVKELSVLIVIDKGWDQATKETPLLRLHRLRNGDRFKLEWSREVSVEEGLQYFIREDDHAKPVVATGTGKGTKWKQLWEDARG
jgi:hypothetical protein